MTVERVEFPAPTPGKHRKGDIAVLADIANSRQISEVPASSVDQDMQEGSAEEDEDDRELVPLHIEAKLKSRSTVRLDTIKRLLGSFILENYSTLEPETLLTEYRDIPLLNDNLLLVRVAECSLPLDLIPLHCVSLEIHVYQPSSHSEIEEFSAAAPVRNEDGDEEIPSGDPDDDVAAASVLDLPSEGLDGIWPNLIFESGIKDRLLNYIYSTILLSDAGVDFNVISYNRVVLLHGPPGTGKTSLCRALAQKLSVRLSSRYSHGKLVEINSHSLFSKWFSESGKLVQRLFSHVTQLVDDEDAFVVVLIDEVESLTSARAGAISGKEPSDALRVVNALLTQLDKLRTRKNVLVVTTSNLSHSIDSAFVDRADIKQYIGLPPAQAVYWILSACLRELMRCDLIKTSPISDWKAVELYAGMEEPTETAASVRAAQEAKTMRTSLRLYRLSVQCREKELSGRSLRRLPVLAHARYVGMSSEKSRNVETWIAAMERIVEEEAEQLEKVEKGC